MNATPDVRPHERRQCTALAKTTGKRCKRAPIPGGTVCNRHGASTPQVRKSAARRLALGEAQAELAKLGRPIVVDPADAMLAVTHEAAGNQAFWRGMVQSLNGDQLAVDGEPHPWLVEYERWCDHVVKWSKLCRDAGVDERRVQVSENQARQLAVVLSGVFNASMALIRQGMSPDEVQRHHFPAIARRAIESMRKDNQE